MKKCFIVYFLIAVIVLVFGKPVNRKKKIHEIEQFEKASLNDYTHEERKVKYPGEFSTVNKTKSYENINSDKYNFNQSSPSINELNISKKNDNHQIILDLHPHQEHSNKHKHGNRHKYKVNKTGHKFNALKYEGHCGSFEKKSVFCSNECCSKLGYCGTTAEYCNEGCQSEFGLCGNINSNINE